MDPLTHILLLNALGLTDPTVEKARQLANVDLVYPIVTTDKLSDVVRKRDPRANDSYLKRFDGRDVGGLFMKENPAVYVNANSKHYKEKDLPFLASIIAHENKHASGFGEEEAYSEQLNVLDRLGYDKRSNYYRSLPRWNKLTRNK